MNWRALTTFEYCERSVRNRLHEIGYAAVTPVEMIERIGAGKRRHLMPSPLLPEYCLVGSEAGFDWPLLKHVRGVKGIMQMDGQPAIIPRLAVEDFIDMSERLEAERMTVRERPGLRAGARVRVLAGPYVGYTTEIAALRSLKARVILDILGLAREVEIAVADLEAA